METQEEMLNAMGWTTVCESPHELEHEDGSTATGQSAQIMVDAIIEEYKEMKADEAIEAVENKKAEATKDLDLNAINGSEILEFLSEQLRNNDDLCDVSLNGPFEFEGQFYDDDKGIYTLYFTAYFNNWGEDQAEGGNSIRITNDSVRVLVGEPFEGDGSDEELENVLREWLKTHEFTSEESIKEIFEYKVNMCKEKLGEVTFKSKGLLDVIINELQEAKKLMK